MKGACLSSAEEVAEGPNLRLDPGAEATRFFTWGWYTGSILDGGWMVGGLSGSGGDTELFGGFFAAAGDKPAVRVSLGPWPLCRWGGARGALRRSLPPAGVPILGGLLWRTVCLVLMAGLAFGWNKSALKRGGVFILLSMAMGGVAVSFGRGDFFAVVLAAGLVWLLCRAAFGDRIGGREYVPMELSFGGKTAKVLALRDTGNTLRDPISGEPVLVIAGGTAQTLTGLTAQQIASPLETLTQQPIPGLRLIPYRAVGQGGSMLLALRLDKASPGGKRETVLAAFAPEGLGEGQMVQALCN